MSWGHAVSRDLLHWEQKDDVLFPDETGTMFSGSGIVNDRKMLGLPEDAVIFFYTAAGNNNTWSAGKQFTQRIAYSTDGGDTLHKIDKGVLPTVFTSGESLMDINFRPTVCVMRHTLIRWLMRRRLTAIQENCV